MPAIESTLPNYVKPDYKKDGPRLQYFSTTGNHDPVIEAKVPESDKTAGITATKATIHDARELQANSKMSKAEFFREHGFVLLT
jgi:hypothetical protein